MRNMRNAILNLFLFYFEKHPQMDWHCCFLLCWIQFAICSFRFGLVLTCQRFTFLNGIKYFYLVFVVCWHKQFSILLPSKVNHIDSVISSHLGRSRLDDKKEYFKISCAIELFNWNYRRLKMVNNGYLTWHQRNHGIVSFPFKHKHTPSPSPSPSSSKHLDNQTKRQWNVMWHIIRTIRFFISILLKA